MRLFSAQQVLVVVVEGSVITVMNPHTSRGNARKDETAAVADSAAADAEAVAGIVHILGFIQCLPHQDFTENLIEAVVTGPKKWNDRGGILI